MAQTRTLWGLCYIIQYMYIYIYIYIYIYVHIDDNIYIYIYTYTHIHIITYRIIYHHVIPCRTAS